MNREINRGAAPRLAQPLGRNLLFFPNVDNGVDCVVQAASILGPFPSVRNCLKKGATIAWSPAATGQARQNVQAQLAEVLK